MNARTPPPRGLRWTDSATARVTVWVLIVISLLLTIYIGYRYTRLTDCLNAGDTADQRRTRAIAEATDAERRAEDAYLRDPVRGLAGLLAARADVDRVRADNPAPIVVPCR